MSFTNYLNNSAREIEYELSRLFIQWEKDIVRLTPRVSSVIRVFMKSMIGGKKLRGALVRLGYQLDRHNDIQDIVQAACAYEILHTALLIHDDIFDESTLRRGNPTAHYTLGGGHYGTSQAICLGDVGFFLALTRLRATNFPIRLKEKAEGVFIHTAHDTIVGQMMDIEGSRQKKGYTEKDVIDMYRTKTARYSFTGPLMVGAILAGAQEENISLLQTFGDNIGIAYQIQDDIFGMFGNTKTIGKPVDSDMKEGKMTILYLLAGKRANRKQKNTLTELYGKKTATRKDFTRVKDIMHATGALQYAQMKVREYVEKGRSVIPKITIDLKTQHMLVACTEYIAGENTITL